MLKLSKWLTIFFALFVTTTIYANIKDVYPIFCKIVHLAGNNYGEVFK